MLSTTLKFRLFSRNQWNVGNFFYMCRRLPRTDGSMFVTLDEYTYCNLHVLWILQCSYRLWRSETYKHGGTVSVKTMQHSARFIHNKPAVDFLLSEQSQQQRCPLGLWDGRVWYQSRCIDNKAAVVSAWTTESVLNSFCCYIFIITINVLYLSLYVFYVM